MTSHPRRAGQRFDRLLADFVRFEDVHFQPHPLLCALDGLVSGREGFIAVGEERQPVAFRSAAYVLWFFAMRSMSEGGHGLRVGGLGGGFLVRKNLNTITLTRATRA